jgi:hypothetical protein
MGKVTARMKKVDAQNILVGSAKGKSHLGDLDEDGSIFKCILKKYDTKVVNWVNVAWDESQWWSSNAPLGFIKVCKFLGQLSAYSLLKFCAL